MSTAPKNRIASIDIVRGMIMIVMALDHTRDFFHNDAMVRDPLDLTTTTPILFFTRWITHFCAPGFVFLSGISIYLTGLGRTKNSLQAFLIKRGAWLIVVEIVIMSLILGFNPAYNMVFLSVLWAIGMSMIITGLIIRLPYTALLIIGIFIFFGHNILDIEPVRTAAKGNMIVNILHGAPGVFPLTAKHVVLLSYSVLPWTGIMILGYCVGRLFTAAFSSAQRKKLLLQSGGILLLIFVVLRWLNIYGDPVAWTSQKNGFYTLLGFLNLNKYPPSLLFSSVTIGALLIMLSLTENSNNKVSRVCMVYGRVPFFYFLLHFFLIRLLCVAAFFLNGYTAKDIPSVPFYFRPETFGYTLPVVYMIWILVVLMSYPLCVWYGNYKRRAGKWWLSYL